MSAAAEIPGVNLESDFYNNAATIETISVPDHAQRTTAAAANANPVYTPGVSLFRIIGMNRIIIDVTNDNNSNSDNDGIDDINPKEKKEMQVNSFKMINN